ncbi:DNA-directed RNA polymerase I and III subunit [Penicillium cosmopolitanum]|uniref:DNA-directed RNA polymerase I and III subunit n=1 Tax=Penicillium cosmopolitanum TaxID=1131564 RepID=A0A9W9SDK3_9EURO|nr:DNA-directed RNA polymerase I and III subunit [Penicillium cosmopolitanum]KAJ5376415.1 DNA-directed RNA polymerase I and III subunit [Penicillium cosmopolitanum]
MPASVHSQEPQEADQSMIDAEPEVDPIMLEEKRVVVLPGSSETSASFQFENEGHTMGNALRYAIMKNPAVEFCGYTIPIPLTPRCTFAFRQLVSLTKWNGWRSCSLPRTPRYTTTALEALEKGFSDLMDLCDVVTEKFTDARDQFNEENSNRMQS